MTNKELGAILGVGTGVLEVDRGIWGASGHWHERPHLRWREIEPEIDADEVREVIAGIDRGWVRTEMSATIKRVCEAWLKSREPTPMQKMRDLAEYEMRDAAVNEWITGKRS